MGINKSKAYVLPLLSFYVDIKFINKIQNTYLFLKDDLNNYIIIKYKKDDSQEFTDYLITLSTSDHCHKIDYLDDVVVCIFLVDESIQEDYDNFVLGRFSKLSKKSKRKILSFSVSNYGNGSVKVITKIKQILYKDSKLREELEEELDVRIPDDIELTSKPNLDAEILML